MTRPQRNGAFHNYISMVSAYWHYAEGRRHYMILCYFLFFCANTLNMMQPLAIGYLINTLQRGGPNLVQNMLPWLAAYFGTSIGFWVFHGPARVLERRQAYYVRFNFYHEMYQKLVGLPLSLHHHHHSGNSMNRINKAAAALYNFVGRQFLYLETVLRYIIVLMMLAFISWKVAGAILVFSWMVFFALTRMDRHIMHHIHQANEKDHLFSSRFFDYIGNISSVVALSLEKDSQKKLTQEQTKILPHIERQSILIETKWGTMTSVSAIFYFIILFFYISGAATAGNALMLGTLVTIFQYITRLDQVFTRVADLYQQVAQDNTDRAAVRSIIDDYKKLNIEHDKQKALQTTQGGIRFENVGFSYVANKPVFENFSLTIKPGEKVGLVGLSGAGKTTLVQLLLRFYEPSSGRILIDEQSISDATPQSLRQNIALIPQDISLFEASVGDNISVAKVKASQAEIIEAAKWAGAHDFIMHLPQGYETLVGERGVKLSGGQRQRIAVARAFLKAAPILILDEATSALDSATESQIQTALDSVMVGKTTLAIAHRLSTLRRMDWLIVLEQGKIVEQGTHDELLALKGYYARMWTMQVGGFLPTNEKDIAMDQDTKKHG